MSRQGKGPHISQRDPETVFELMNQIGSGSYGSVHKAKIIKSGKLAAVKRINMDDGEELDDVENEIAMLEKCNDENVVAYYGSFIKSKTMWIAMEFCGGGSVSDIYNATGEPLTEAENCLIMQQSLQGLHYLHTAHMIHRDIKGGNILLTDQGQVKLADLGVSAQITSTLARRKSFIGTPYWIAPEIIAVEMKMGPDSYSSKCDIWSLGITAIEFAEMQPPMFDLHPMRALYLIPKNPAPRLTDKSKWTKDFREFVKSSLVKNPTKRETALKLLKHSWFKKAPNQSVTVALIAKARKAKGEKGPKSAEGVFNDDDEVNEEGDRTVTPSSRAHILQRLPSQRKANGADRNVEVVNNEPEGPVQAKGWEQKNYIPIAQQPAQQKMYKKVALPPAPSSSRGKTCSFCKTSLQGMSDAAIKDHVDHCAREAGSAPTAAGVNSSFVLSNVFAGCPLSVLCAASWQCNVSGREPELFIIVGAETGLYVLETSGDKRELVQVSKRRCTWLYVMDEEGIMVSVSGKGLVCVHDLNSLLVGPTEEIRFKTTKLIEGAKGGKCAMTRTPDTNYTFLCVAVTKQLLLMQWYEPRRKFMKLKDFQTPFEDPPVLMELVILKDEPLPVLCVGATRDKQSRGKKLAIVNPNDPPEKVAKHMAAELGWVRVRSGREDVFATAVKQVGGKRFMLCFSNVATFIEPDGTPSVLPGEPEKIVFETPPETCVYTPDAVIAFSKHRMERRSTHTGRITHQMKDKGETFRVVGKEGNIIIETRGAGESTSHLYLLLRKKV